ncbi:hypothetical protein N9Q18_01575 [bacterium]|nr:hypothetical protein [bacterium]
MSFSLWSLTRRALCCVGLTGAVIAAGVVTATVTSQGQGLALTGATESTVVTVEPTRVLDTRINVGLNGPFAAGTPRKLTVTGTITTYFAATETTTQQQVVPTGATGVLLNVTGVSPTRRGWIAVRPGNATGISSTSNLNMVPGQVVPNGVTVEVPTTGTNAGQIDIMYGAAAGTVNIVIDIVGYTTNTGLLDLANRVEQLENSGVAGPQGPQGEPGAAGVDAESPARVIWVADDTTGDFTSLSAALASIDDNTATKPYVIKIAPGTYTETANVAMKNYVDVEGSGQNTTTINCACSNNNISTAAVISAGAITAEIRHLTINNTGGSNNISVGVYTNGFTIDGVVTVNNVTATAIVTVGGEGATSVGVYNNSSSPKMNNVTATANGGDVADEASGVSNISSSPTMTNVTATATEGTFNRGVYNTSSSPKMNNVTATAKGGSGNYGVYNLSLAAPTIRNSSIDGTTNSIFNSASSAQVADSMLKGLVAGGSFTCVGVHNDFVALDEICDAVEVG